MGQAYPVFIKLGFEEQQGSERRLRPLLLFVLFCWIPLNAGKKRAGGGTSVVV